MGHRHHFTAATAIEWGLLDGSVRDECLHMAESLGEPQIGFRSLRELAALAAVTDLRIWSYVRSARRNGASWAAIGQALGISRQAAQQRFASVDPAQKGLPA